MQSFFRRTVSEFSVKININSAVAKATDAENLSLDPTDAHAVIKLALEYPALVLAAVRAKMSASRPAIAHLATLLLESIVNGGNSAVHAALETDAELHSALLALATKRGADPSSTMLQRTARRVVLEIARMFEAIGGHPRLSALGSRYESTTGKQLVRAVILEQKRVKVAEPGPSDIRWISPIKREPKVAVRLRAPTAMPSSQIGVRGEGSHNEIRSPTELPTVSLAAVLHGDPNANNFASPTSPVASPDDDTFEQDRPDVEASNAVVVKANAIPNTAPAGQQDEHTLSTDRSVGGPTDSVPAAAEDETNSRGIAEASEEVPHPESEAKALEPLAAAAVAEESAIPDGVAVPEPEVSQSHEVEPSSARDGRQMDSGSEQIAANVETEGVDETPAAQPGVGPAAEIVAESDPRDAVVHDGPQQSGASDEVDGGQYPKGSMEPEEKSVNTDETAAVASDAVPCESQPPSAEATAVKTEEAEAVVPTSDAAPCESQPPSAEASQEGETKADESGSDEGDSVKASGASPKPKSKAAKRGKGGKRR